MKQQSRGTENAHDFPAIEVNSNGKSQFEQWRLPWADELRPFGPDGSQGSELIALSANSTAVEQAASSSKPDFLERQPTKNA
jgi:hypothetical protein